MRLRALSAFICAMLAAATVFAAQPTTTIGDISRGDYVVLTGDVVRFSDEDEFVLRDDTGSVRVYIGYQNRMPVRPGQRVTVEGFVDFDLRIEVYAWTVTLEDGSVIELKR